MPALHLREDLPVMCPHTSASRTLLKLPASQRPKRNLHLKLEWIKEENWRTRDGDHYVSVSQQFWKGLSWSESSSSLWWFLCRFQSGRVGFLPITFLVMGRKQFQILFVFLFRVNLCVSRKKDQFPVSNNWSCQLKEAFDFRVAFCLLTLLLLERVLFNANEIWSSDRDCTFL